MRVVARHCQRSRVLPISRANTSDRPDAFSIVTAECRKLWNEISLASRECERPFLLFCSRALQPDQRQREFPETVRQRSGALVPLPNFGKM